jgi:hypothetical protein
MSENESGLVAEFIAPCKILINTKTEKEFVNPASPYIRDAIMTVMPKNNFLLTLSETFPAINPKNAYGKV